MAPRSTTRATARSRPGCTAWCSSMAQPQPSSALPGAGRRVPAQCRRHAGVRRSPRAERRGAAGGVAPDHRPIDEAAHPSGGAGRRGGFDLRGRQRRRFGRGPHAQAAAGGGVYLPHRLRPAPRAEGADGAGRHAQADGVQADPVRRYQWKQSSTPPCAARPTTAMRWSNCAAPSTARQLARRSQPASKDRSKHVGRCVPPLFCRIRGAAEQEKGV